MNKFQNIYRTQSVRLQGKNYSQAGYYFITISKINRNVFWEILKTTQWYYHQ